MELVGRIRKALAEIELPRRPGPFQEKSRDIKRNHGTPNCDYRGFQSDDRPTTPAGFTRGRPLVRARRAPLTPRSRDRPFLRPVQSAPATSAVHGARRHPPLAESAPPG